MGIHRNPGVRGEGFGFLQAVELRDSKQFYVVLKGEGGPMFDSDIKVMMQTKERAVAVNLALTQFLGIQKLQNWWGRGHFLPFLMY